MSWWSRKPDQPKPTGSNVVPFRRADRPEVIDRLRRNAARHSSRQKESEASRLQTGHPRTDPSWDFKPMPWENIDEVLWAARRDLHRGLVKGDSILIAIYDEIDDRIVWYQLGMSDEEVVAAFDEWRDGQ